MAGMNPTTALKNPNRFEDASPVETTTMLIALKKTYTGPAEPQELQYQNKQQAVAATRRKSPGVKTQNALDVWPDSAARMMNRTIVLALENAAMFAKINAGAAVPQPINKPPIEPN